MNKLEKVRAHLRAMQIDALFVTSELNQRYLLDYAFTDGMLVITAEKAYMVTDFRYYEEAQSKANPAFEVVMPSPRIPFVTDVLKKAEAKTVGFESATLSYDEYMHLKDIYGEFSFVSVGNLFSKVREVKTAEELADMAKAQSITDMAFAHILKTMTPTMTEIEVALELEFFMRKNGADGLAFETIAVSGSASALPHGKPRNIPLQKGFLTMDYGASYNGYCSDMTRTIVIGKADADMKHLYETVLSAQRQGLAAVRAGVSGQSVDTVARDIIDATEYKGCFGHSLGHGVGLFIHESPRISQSGTQLLEVGNVVTVEPGIYVQGKYGCRIEDMVAVEENGCHNFTASPKEMIELF